MEGRREERDREERGEEKRGEERRGEEIMERRADQTKSRYSHTWGASLHVVTVTFV